MSLPQISMIDSQPPQPDPTTPERTALRFILVETSRPGNIGAAARAMKTMGFADLVLVRPRFADAASQPEAVAFASGAQDVLAAARIVESIDEALDGCNFAAAVTARLREFSPPVSAPRALAAQLGADAALRAALVFGNERFGLPNQIVEKCNVLVSIPANPAYSSLNLAQAVQIMAYEMALALPGGPEAVGSGGAVANGSMAVSGNAAGTAIDAAGPNGGAGTRHVVGFHGEAADLAQVDAMFSHLEEALVAIDFLDPASPKKLMTRLRRLFARTTLETEEVNILRGIARQILKRGGSS
jgi:tRNA/rRNA methyltransferase